MRFSISAYGSGSGLCLFCVSYFFSFCISIALLYLLFSTFVLLVVVLCICICGPVSMFFICFVRVCVSLFYHFVCAFNTENEKEEQEQI